jgi:hypothetical protein
MSLVHSSKLDDTPTNWLRTGVATSRETYPYRPSPDSRREFDTVFGSFRLLAKPIPHARTVSIAHPIGHSVSPDLGQVLRTAQVTTHSNFISGIRTNFTVSAPHRTSKGRPKTAPTMSFRPAKVSIDSTQSDNRQSLSNPPPTNIAMTSLSAHSRPHSESSMIRKDSHVGVEPSVRERLAFFSTVTAVHVLHLHQRSSD